MSDDSQPAIAFCDVTVEYDRKCVLSGFDLDVAPGRTTVLIGPSGCGKSTLLRLVVGLVAPTSGRVLALGEEVCPAHVESLRRRLGYVIQEGGLFPHLTARDNASLLARHLGWEEERLRARLDELSDMAHLERALLERFPFELSGGERQRVGLLRALVLDPEVLLLDEPLGALDPMIRADLQSDLRAIFRRLEKTVLLVTHDLAEAGYLGDEVVLLREGTVVQRGAIESLFTSPANEFAERFVNAQRRVLTGADGPGGAA